MIFLGLRAVGWHEFWIDLRGYLRKKVATLMNKSAEIISVNIEDEMRDSYLDYAMSVIIGRAIPDVRDGLKPVHRRILYAMLREGLLSNKKFSKCAGVVGEVLKKYHPQEFLLT